MSTGTDQQPGRQRLVGRSRRAPRLPATPARTLRHVRWPGSKHRILRIQGRYNPKTLQRERVVSDKRPLWWAVSLSVMLAVPLLTGDQKYLQIASTFAIYASINLMWILVLGTAGILSLASLAICGVGAYTACWLTINEGLPWPLMFPVAGIAGLIVGMIIAVPARRLDGMYYALLTLGVSEICRSYALQASWLHALAQGSIQGGGGFIPDHLRFTVQGQRIGYASAFALMLCALFVYRRVNGQRLGLLLRASHRADEAVAESMGIAFQRARLQVFLISSAGLGVIGGFYAGYYRAASLDLFSVDRLLLLFAMTVIGGIGRAEGAVLGTLVVTVINEYFVDTGAKRVLFVALLMLGSVLFTRGGAFGLRDQWNELRNRRRSQARAARSTRTGDVLPEEAPEFRDKAAIYQRRFDRGQRTHLRSLVTDEMIDEHKRSPTGLHSKELERVLLYFRKAEIMNKYAVYAVKPFEAYRIVALSGVPGVPPRVVDERTYHTIDEAYHAVFLRRVGDLRAN